MFEVYVRRITSKWMCLCDGVSGGEPGRLHGISERLVLTLMLLTELGVLHHGFLLFFFFGISWKPFRLV